MARLLVSESPDAFCEQAFYGNCLRAAAKNLPLAPILSMTELVILDSADRRGPGTPTLGARGAFLGAVWRRTRDGLAASSERGGVLVWE